MENKIKGHRSTTKLVGWLIPLLVMAVMLGQAFRVTAQTSGFGSIVGTVVDASNASVPDVAITVTHDATGVVRTATTDVNGNYLADKMLAGQYTIAAERAGFKRYVNAGVTLHPIQSLRVNVTLEVGAVTEEITVTAQTSVLETERAEIGWTRTAQELRDLPVITASGGFGAATYPTRDPLNFVFTLPGTQVARSTSAGKLSIYGANQASTIVRVDGVTVRDNSNGVAYAGRPIIEATADLKVIGLNAAPEFDGQANVLITTKGGGNEFHGGAMYEGQQRAWTAQTWELNRGNIDQAFSKRNNAAFWIGGPLKQDKAFFFAAYDHERGAQTDSSLATRNKPLPAFRTGDFSALLDTTFANKYLNGTPIQLVDPMNANAPFEGNIIPTARLNATSLLIQNEFWMDNPTRGGLTNNAPLAALAPRDGEKFDIRTDYNFTDAHRMFVHFNIQDYREESYDGNWEGAKRLSTHPAKQFSISDTYSLSPTVLNEFRFGHYRHHYNIQGEENIAGRDYQNPWGIQGIGITPGLPDINMGGSAHNIGSIGALIFDSRNYEVLNNVSVLKGKHQYKFGYSMNRPSFYFKFFLRETGYWAFSNKFTNYAYSDFLLGYPTSSSLWFGPRPGIEVAANEHNWYLQDTFQATRRLTLEYGIRYQYHQRASAKRDQLANFDPATGNIVVPSETSLQTINRNFPTDIPIVTSRDAGFPFNMIENDTNDLAPRVSFAYRLDQEGKTVIRGGYGLYYVTYIVDMSGTLGNFGPYRGTANSTNLLQAGTTVPELQFPSPYLPPDPATGNVFISSVDKDLRNAQFHQYNLTIEREIAGNRLSIGAIGNWGTHSIGRNIAQVRPQTIAFERAHRIYPNFGSLTSFTKDNILKYNAVQVVGERRFKKGLFFRASYNWTKSLTRDDCDSGPVCGNSVENAYDIANEKGNIRYTPRHRGLIVYSYELPFGPGKAVPAQGILGQMIGGWQVNGIATFRSGLWFNPTFSGYDPSGTGTSSGRPDRTGIGSGQKTLSNWFDASAFACPGQTTQICDPANVTPIGRFGNSGRNILDGPGTKQMDFSIQKSFPIQEAMLLEVQVQFINLFNTPQFRIPGATNITTPGVGEISNTLVGSNRQIQFGARFEF